MSLDRNEKVLKWGSENYVIPYVDATRGNSTHRYYVDLFFELADGEKWLLEIKPQNQAVFTPSKRKKIEKQIAEASIVARNRCKWTAAVSFCKSKGWHFRNLYRKGDHKTLLIDCEVFGATHIEGVYTYLPIVEVP